MAPLNCTDVIKLLSTDNVKIAGPLLALFVGFQILTDLKFSCPCSVGWNQAIPVFIIVVPAVLAPILMLLFLKLKVEKTSEQFHTQENSGTSQPKETKQICRTCFGFLVPSVVWICLCLIDGDYIGCAATVWDGKYACDKELHSNCLNWCNPEFNQGTNMTELYDYTRKAINISKVIGYSLAFLSCILAILSLKSEICKSRNCCGGQDPENPTITTNENQEPIGPTRSQGSQEPIGPTRSEGSQEPIGPTRSQGSQEPTGLTRSQGSQEPTGLTRSQGSQEPTGLTRSEGSQEPTALTRSEGSEKPTGRTRSEGNQVPTNTTKSEGEPDFKDDARMIDSEDQTEKDKLLK